MHKKRTDLITAFLSLSSEKDANDFFEDIFTPQELEALEERWQIVQAFLGSGLPQREIAKKIGVSVALVSRASRQIKYGTGAFLKVHNTLQKNND